MQFYSYLWLREDGTPYYAGKGHGQRAYVRGSHSLRPPTDSQRIVVYPAATEAEAFAQEQVFIDLFGRADSGVGCLHNFTDGGDGVSGMHHSDGSRARMSIAKSGKPSWNKGIPQTPEHVAKLSAVRKGKRAGIPRPPHVLAALHSVETQAKSAASRIGLKRSNEAKEHMRVAALSREARKRAV